MWADTGDRALCNVYDESKSRPSTKAVSVLVFGTLAVSSSREYSRISVFSLLCSQFLALNVVNVMTYP